MAQSLQSNSLNDLSHANKNVKLKSEKSFPELKRLSSYHTNPGDPIFFLINGRRGILAEEKDGIIKLAKKAGIKIQDFLKYNDMEKNDKLNAGQVYYLQSKYDIGMAAFHTMKKGQTLWEVSQIYGLRYKNLKALNKIKEGEWIEAGRVLWLQKYGQPIVLETRNERKTLAYARISNEFKPIHVSKELPKPKSKDVLNENFYTQDLRKKVTNVRAKSEELIPVKENSKTNDPVIENSTVVPKKEIVIESGKHRIGKGETYYSIAKKYGITMNDLYTMNDLDNSKNLEVGELLIVKKRHHESQLQPLTNYGYGQMKTGSVDKNLKTHKVAAGETIYSISKQYGITIQALRNSNDLKTNIIEIGQMLIIENIDSSVPILYHTVQSGETLFSISNKYNLSQDYILAINRKNSLILKVGERLTLK
jgi:membrane-bound lytic murein transglycosylase D